MKETTHEGLARALKHNQTQHWYVTGVCLLLLVCFFGGVWLLPSAIGLCLMGGLPIGMIPVIFWKVRLDKARERIWARTSKLFSEQRSADILRLWKDADARLKAKREAWNRA